VHSKDDDATSHSKCGNPAGHRWMQRLFDFIVGLFCCVSSSGFLFCYILLPTNGGKVEDFIDSEDREYKRANAAVPEQTKAIREVEEKRQLNDSLANEW